jgi:hypothetical protein
MLYLYTKYYLILRMILHFIKHILFVFLLVISGCTKDQKPACESNGNSNDICSVQYIIDGKNEKIEFYTYQNNKVHLIEQEDKKGNITVTLIEYENGKISKKNTSDFKGKTLKTVEYNYKNDLLEKEIFNKDSVIEFHYTNQVMDKITYSNNNILVSWDTILYYPNQKIYQQKKYNEKNDLIKIEEYKWFVNYTFTQETILPDGTVTKKIINNTNPQNQIIQQNIYNQNNDLIEQNKKSYKNNLLIYESFNQLNNNSILEIIYHRIP